MTTTREGGGSACCTTGRSAIALQKDLGTTTDCWSFSFRSFLKLAALHSRIYSSRAVVSIMAHCFMDAGALLYFCTILPKLCGTAKCSEERKKTLPNGEKKNLCSCTMSSSAIKLKGSAREALRAP